MNLRWIALGHIKGLRRRWTRTLLSIIAVGAGASLVVGLVISKHSLEVSLDTFATRLSGTAALRVEGPSDHGGLDASVLPKVAAVPGVKAAVPLVLAIAQAVDSHGHEILVPAIGVDCAAQALVGSFNCTPAIIQSLGDNPVLGPALHKRLGPHGALRTDLGEIPTGTALTIDGLKQINGGLVAMFELGAAQRQFVRPNGLDQILVVSDKTVATPALRRAIEGVVGETNTVVAGDAPITGSLVASLIIPFLFIISLIGLVIGSQLVRNTMELSLEERRRELATTAALGATPRDVMTGLLAEGLVIGVLGGLFSIVCGLFVARAFVGSLSDQLAKATGLHIPVSTSTSAIVIGVAVGVIVAIASSIGPARRASKLDLVAELSDRARYRVVKSSSRRSLIITSFFAAVALTLGYVAHSGGSLRTWQPPALIVALVVNAIVAYVAAAQLTPRLLAALQRAPGFGTGPLCVALTSVLASRRRTGALVVALAAPVYVSVVLGGLVPGMSAAANRFAHDQVNNSVWVSTLGVNNTAAIDAKVTPAMEARLAALPGVARIDHIFFAPFQHTATERNAKKSSLATTYAIDGIEGAPPNFHVYEGSSATAAFARGRVMIGPGLARQHRLRAGDSIVVPGRLALTRYVVGGIWASPESVGFSITMSGDQLRGLLGVRPPDFERLIPTAGTSVDELARVAVAAHIDPRLRIYTPDQVGTHMATDFGEIAAPFKALQYALIVVALVATASTLILAAAQRRRDNAVLVALGMTPIDLARATIIETALIAGATAVTTALTAQLMLVSFTWSSELVSGLRIPYRLDALGVLAAALIVSTIAVIGATVPAIRTARTNVIASLRAT